MTQQRSESTREQGRGCKGENSSPLLESIGLGGEEEKEWGAAERGTQGNARGGGIKGVN